MLDRKQSEIVYNKNWLANSLSVARMIEMFTKIDDHTVYTSGYERFQEIKNAWKLNRPPNENIFMVDKDKWTAKTDDKTMD